MGKCGGDDTKPYKFTLNDLTELKIDETKEMPKGCGPNIEGTQGGSRYDALINRGWGWPDNGEFEYAGGGSACGLCSDVGGGYGCECSGGNAIVGTRGKIKRILYKGDVTQCCLKNTLVKDGIKTIDGNTCDAQSRNPASTECNAILTNYCTGDKIINDDYCKNLNNSNNTLYTNLMKGYCNANDTNAKKDICINWCASNSTSCTRLNTIQDCAKHEITSDCSPQKIIDTKTECKKYGMLSEQGLSVGAYSCTVSGIESLKKDCELYDLDLETCTATGIGAAKVSQQSEAQAQSALEQSNKQFEYTKTALSQVLSLPENVNQQQIESTELPELPEPTTKSTNQMNMIIIIVVALILFGLLCSSSSLLFATSKK